VRLSNIIESAEQASNMDYDDYDEFTITALRSKADERGLPVTGLKVDLIARLQDDDRRKYNNRLHNGAFKDHGM
jgi:hypothetical protein